MTSAEQDSALAAEYVLGVLSSTERHDVERRMSREPGFSDLVGLWQEHLSGFDTQYGTTVPPAWIKRSIDRKLFEDHLPPSVFVFLSACAACVVAAFFIVAAILPPADPQRVAELRSDTTAYEFFVEVEADSATVRLVTGVPPDGGSFELWYLVPDAAPVSMGVFESAVAWEEQGLGQLTTGATLAVSLEPLGGSPTGAPTGPVLAVGVLEDV